MHLTTMIVTVLHALQRTEAAQTSSPFCGVKIPVRSLNATFSELVASRCPFCRMLAHIKPASLDGVPCSVDVIAAARATVALPRIDNYNVALPFLLLRVVHRDGHDILYNKRPILALLESNDRQINFGPRSLQPTTIDYDLIKNPSNIATATTTKLVPVLMAQSLFGGTSSD
jgi:hypothetical protein